MESPPCNPKAITPALPLLSQTLARLPGAAMMPRGQAALPEAGTMGAVRTALAIAGIGLLVVACAAPRQTFERVVYGDPAKPYLGKTKTEIMTCAGTPASQS